MPISGAGLDLEAIRKINHTAVNADGTVKSFKEQLLEYEYGYYNALLPFIVSGNSQAISQADAQNHPIIMNANVLAKLKQKHDLVPMEIAELPKMILENNVIMMDSYTFRPGGLVMYLDTVGIHDAPLFVAFHLDEKSGEVSVNRLASVYERANIEFTICKTWEMGLNLYPNGKTENWLKSLGLQLPDNLASSLNGNYRSVSKDLRVPATDIIAGQTGHIKSQDKAAALRTSDIHRLRRDAEFRSAADFAHAAGIDAKLWAGVERGTRKLPADLIEPVARTLGVSASRLMEMRVVEKELYVSGRETYSLCTEASASRAASGRLAEEYAAGTPERTMGHGRE